MALQVDMVVVHCSDSTWGDAAVIDQWHKERKWKGIGYHGVILNGLRTSHGEYDPTIDGLLESGRPLDEIGAHCKGYNSRSVGICMIGRDHFTESQHEALVRNLMDLLRHFKLDPDAVYGHYELDDHKTCPNMDMDLIREKLWEMWA
ncbi:N-acetylmuramyl-L-alanine amidase, negative regulator of AmpC, AmpD [Maridesulfovibrio salexigens DSM 2638]|uniref:N-acetylmuramyl-L-alanine amidase, negative regulator of AmpC, AmpD n=1 Tax=Maridesulfovibrio salexigens (strain ATCC 14822 / DSM 2638 / NCIMB 8403 / VKM B-1763) TaxID=526222 RepID=C6BVY6_MARSD|nr:N-acetylmuramyl-L-alanine amidase, negative regulator of AmpC, AmpD [Maridesulfovibrio salexigens DSM 2638]